MNPNKLSLPKHQASDLAKIDIRHSFRPSQFYNLARHPAINQIENVNMDEGRFFIHLNEGFEYAPNGYGYKKCMSFGSVREARKEIGKAKWL